MKEAIGGGGVPWFADVGSHFWEVLKNPRYHRVPCASNGTARPLAAALQGEQLAFFQRPFWLGQFLLGSEMFLGGIVFALGPDVETAAGEMGDGPDAPEPLTVVLVGTFVENLVGVLVLLGHSHSAGFELVSAEEVESADDVATGTGDPAVEKCQRQRHHLLAHHVLDPETDPWARGKSRIGFDGGPAIARFASHGDAANFTAMIGCEPTIGQMG